MTNLEKAIFDEEGGKDYQAYRYISTAEVSQALEGFGYGPSKKYVDALYIRSDEKQGVGVLKINEEHCRDHFGLFRGVDQGEAVAQTLLLLHKFIVGIPDGQSPLLQEITVNVNNPVSPDAVLNMSVEIGDPEGNVFSGNGKILSGEIEISRVNVRGRILSSDLLQKLIERSMKAQRKSPTRFSIQE